MEIPKVLVHATHEAGGKKGGIGAVLEGFLSSPAYNRNIERSLLVGTADLGGQKSINALTDPERGISTIVYAPSLGISGDGYPLKDHFDTIKDQYSVRLLVGNRKFGDQVHQVILVDPLDRDQRQSNEFKYFLSRFGLDSQRHQGNVEYNSVVSAVPAEYAAVRTLLGEDMTDTAVLCHDWLGGPFGARVIMDPIDNSRVLHYAHEQPTARQCVEEMGDTGFYNRLQSGQLLDEFGGCSDGFKRDLLECVVPHFNGILAVGDMVVKELRGLVPQINGVPMEIVYNGLPSSVLTMEERLESRSRFMQYADNLLGFTPDHILAHVARLVKSKGMWRDLQVLDTLDDLFKHSNEKAVLFVLATADALGKDPDDVARWEHDYNWPVHHREDDLMFQDERRYAELVARFNKTHTNTHIVFINQFGFSRKYCGNNMPEKMKFSDFLRGIDLTFGMAPYEPFGISPIEPLASGALGVISSVCGCEGFIKKASQQLTNFCLENHVIVGDYISLPPNVPPNQHYTISELNRYIDEIEEREAKKLAARIFKQLPRDFQEREKRLKVGQLLSSRMSWDVVVEDQLFPALQKIY